MKFHAPGDEPISVNLTSGHTFVVTPEGIETPQMFHREAIAKGCMPETVAQQPAKPAKSQFDRALVIGEAIEAMIAGKNPEDFTGTGKPDLRRLCAKTGFQVSREEADAVWAEVSKD
jgi:hypothetical protein